MCICRDCRLHGSQLVLGHTPDNPAHVLIYFIGIILVIPVDLIANHTGTFSDLLFRRELCQTRADIVAEFGILTPIFRNGFAGFGYIDTVHFPGCQLKRNLGVQTGQRKTIG